MRLETVANFLPTPCSLLNGSPVLTTYSSTAGMCLPPPLATKDPWERHILQCSTAGRQGSSEDEGKIVSTKLTVIMHTWASEKASVWCPPTTTLVLNGSEKAREYTKDSFQPERKAVSEANPKNKPSELQFLPLADFLDFWSWLASITEWVFNSPLLSALFSYLHFLLIEFIVR